MRNRIQTYKINLEHCKRVNSKTIERVNFEYFLNLKNREYESPAS